MCCAISASRCASASGWCCSAPPASARQCACAPSPGWSRTRKDGSVSPGTMSPICRRKRGISALPSRILRSTRICRRARISRARSGRRNFRLAKSRKRSRRSLNCCALNTCSITSPASFPTARSSARRLPAPWSASRASCCSMTRSAMSMPNCATRCGSNCRACCSVVKPPRSTSLRTSARRWRSASG